MSVVGSYWLELVESDAVGKSEITRLLDGRRLGKYSPVARRRTYSLISPQVIAIQEIPPLLGIRPDKVAFPSIERLSLGRATANPLKRPRWPSVNHV